MAIEDLYTDTVDIESVVRTQDDFGSWTEAWGVEFDDLVCHVWTLSGREIDEFAKKQVVADFGLMCAKQDAGAITEQMRVKWGTRILDIVYVTETIPKDKYTKLALLERKEL